jgi:hypothetical protein
MIEFEEVDMALLRISEELAVSLLDLIVHV